MSLLSSPPSILLLVMMVMVACGSTNAANKDGFNIYKDFLRGKNEEEVADSAEGPRTSKLSYYLYRTPLALGGVGGRLQPLQELSSFPESQSADSLFSHLNKRTLNHFKNYMMTKDSPSEEDQADPHKRDSEVFLPTWGLNKNSMLRDSDLAAWKTGLRTYKRTALATQAD